MTKEISITRALGELKLLDKRINRAINEATFGSLTVGGKTPAEFIDVEEINKKAKSDLQSIKQLIKNRNEIKSAIVASNAVTEVEIAGKKMTVAEAIERKTSIEYEELFLSKLRHTYANLVRQVDSINADVTLRLDKHLETLFGKEGKANAQSNEEIVKSFKDANEAKLIDPIDIKNQIDTLTKEIEDFLAEVDYVLSDSNSLTKITISE